jgi:hypothetical protein
MKRDLKPIRVSLTGGNIKQLQKGNATLLKHAQLDETKGTITLYLRPRVHNKLQKAFVKNKGVKLQMIPDEFKKSFEGGFVTGAGSCKKGGGKLLHGVAAQLAKGAVTAAIPAATSALAGYVSGPAAPVVAPLAGVAASIYADKAATKLGNATGAYGLKKLRGKGSYGSRQTRVEKKPSESLIQSVTKTAAKIAVPIAASMLAQKAGYSEYAPFAGDVAREAMSGYGVRKAIKMAQKVAPQVAEHAAKAAVADLAANSDVRDIAKEAKAGFGVGDVEIIRKLPASHGLNFIDPSSPAWHPGPGLKDNSIERPFFGGSFKPAGGYGIGIHPAMNPTRGQSDLRHSRM